MRLFLFSVYTCFFLVVVVKDTIAQSYLRKENNIWMGKNPRFWISGPGSGYTGAGIDFNSGTSQDIFGTWAGGMPWGSINDAAGDHASGATVCDAAGNLLFYTDGVLVYDRNFELMPGGFDILDNGGFGPDTFSIHPVFGGTAPNRDGVVIVPMPGSSHKYYIINSPALFVPVGNGSSWLPWWQGMLYATVVDMELNNGLGAVDPDFRGVRIADSMVGNLHVVTGEDCNYWLLGYTADGKYKAFNITTEGIDTTNPVISSLAQPLSPYIAELNVSPDRRKLILTALTEAQLADFDPATGVVSNEIFIGGQQCRFGAFSPNSQILYLSGLIGLRQYDLVDLTNPFTLLMINNYTAYEFDTPLRLGPDGKIYFAYLGGTVSETVRRIGQPDVFGAGCQVEQVPGSLALLEQVYASLPNEVAIIVYDTASSVQEVPICFHQPPVLSPGVVGTDYHWMANTVGTTFVRRGDDNTASLEATDPGIYAVQYYTSNPCTIHQDTFIVKPVNYSLYLGPDQLSCDDSPVQLEAGEVSDATYLWQDNSTDRQLLAGSSGTYWVEVAKQGCSIRDSVEISIVNIGQDLGADTLVCIEEARELLLHAEVPEGGAALWSTGATTPSIQVTDSGLYSVVVNYRECTATDSIYIHQKYCDCPVQLPSAFSPNGDGRNDYFGPIFSGACPVAQYRLEIYNRWGERVFASFRPEDQWDGTYRGQAADVGTYMYQLKAKVGIHQRVLQRHGDLVLLR